MRCVAIPFVGAQNNGPYICKRMFNCDLMNIMELHGNVLLCSGAGQGLRTRTECGENEGRTCTN